MELSLVGVVEAEVEVATLRAVEEKTQPIPNMAAVVAAVVNHQTPTHQGRLAVLLPLHPEAQAGQEHLA